MDYISNINILKDKLKTLPNGMHFNDIYKIFPEAEDELTLSRFLYKAIKAGVIYKENGSHKLVIDPFSVEEKPPEKNITEQIKTLLTKQGLIDTTIPDVHQEVIKEHTKKVKIAKIKRTVVKEIPTTSTIDTDPREFGNLRRSKGKGSIALFLYKNKDLAYTIRQLCYIFKLEYNQVYLHVKLLEDDKYVNITKPNKNTTAQWSNIYKYPFNKYLTSDSDLLINRNGDIKHLPVCSDTINSGDDDLAIMNNKDLTDLVLSLKDRIDQLEQTIKNIQMDE